MPRSVEEAVEDIIRRDDAGDQGAPADMLALVTEKQTEFKCRKPVAAKRIMNLVFPEMAEDTQQQEQQTIQDKKAYGFAKRNSKCVEANNRWHVAFLLTEARRAADVKLNRDARKTVASQGNEITDLKVEVASQGNKITDLEAKADTAAADIQNMKAVAIRASAKADTAAADIQMMKAGLRKVYKRCQNLVDAALEDSPTKKPRQDDGDHDDDAGSAIAADMLESGSEQDSGDEERRSDEQDSDDEERRSDEQDSDDEERRSDEQDSDDEQVRQRLYHELSPCREIVWQ